MKKNLVCLILSTLLLCFYNMLFADQAESPSIVVLSGDIGGTNARLRLTQLIDGKKTILAKESYKVAQYDKDTLRIIKLFLKKYKNTVKHIDSFCLAVNEPIKNSKSQHYDPEQLKKELNIDKVMLINDLEAVGYGLESITEEQLFTLRKGSPKINEIKAFVAAGTGLGMGFATFDGDKYVIHRSEVGGNTFNPSDVSQYNIYKYLVERDLKPEENNIGKQHENLHTARALVRGNGIVDIYSYYRSRIANEGKTPKLEENTELKELLADPTKDHPKEIANFALSHSNDMQEVAVRASRAFVKIYSEKAKDFAYTLLPYGGLYIVGNIAVSILTPNPTQNPYADIFSETFSNDEVLEDLPVYVVLDTEIGVQGTENCAFKLALLSQTNLEQTTLNVSTDDDDFKCL